MFGKKKETPSEPVWALSICPTPWMDDREQVIDGVRVEFLKPGWSWTVLRDDLSYVKGKVVDSGPTETQEEALEIGLAKLREYREAENGREEER